METNPYEDVGTGTIMALMGAYFFFILIIWLITVIGMWKMFEKAGKPGWAAIIPIYNIIVMLEITGHPIWWLIMLFIPFVNIIFSIMLLHALSKSYGQDVGTTLLFLFLPFIGFPMVGFGSARYIGPVGPERRPV
jgi:hypothetical protein